jgi:tetratricopeptide (TPR) repeat protein
MGYLAYYAAWVLASYAFANPRLLLGVVVVLLLQRWLPDPVRWLAGLRTMRRLSAELQSNPANQTARRDLARAYLERRRPGAARALLDVAVAQGSDVAELWALRGEAELRTGAPAAALESLARALELDPAVGRGEPFRLAGLAHEALGNLEQTEAAFGQAADENASHVASLRLLARVRAARGDRRGAREALDEALSTYATLPGYLRRSQLGEAMQARLARLFV